MDLRVCVCVCTIRPTCIGGLNLTVCEGSPTELNKEEGRMEFFFFCLHLLRCVPSFLPRGGFGRPFPSSIIKLHSCKQKLECDLSRSEHFDLVFMLYG